MGGLGEGPGRLAKVLGLLALPGVGRRSLERYWGPHGPEWLDRDFADLASPWIGALVPDGALAAEALARGMDQGRALAGLGVRALFRGGDGFPEELERLPRPPRLVFVRGRRPLAPLVAVVGTREPSPWGLERARQCGLGLARAGYAVLNGLARGVDEAALSGALEARGACVGVLARGHGAADGPAGAGLASRVLASGGWLVSEYAPDEGPDKGKFIERDRIQAGLAAAVLVIESGEHGGTAHTVRAASGAKVPVLALEPEPGSRSAGGNRLWIAQGLATGVAGPAALARAFEGAGVAPRPPGKA